jgi:hypothetical protein
LDDIPTGLNSSTSWTKGVVATAQVHRARLAIGCCRIFYTDKETKAINQTPCAIIAIS